METTIRAFNKCSEVIRKVVMCGHSVIFKINGQLPLYHSFFFNFSKKITLNHMKCIFCEPQIHFIPTAFLIKMKKLNLENLLLCITQQ